MLNKQKEEQNKLNEGEDYDDLNADSELLKEKRREELLAYEQLLFGENPSRMYTVDETNPKPFIRYDFDEAQTEFGKCFVLLIWMFRTVDS